LLRADPLDYQNRRQDNATSSKLLNGSFSELRDLASFATRSVHCQEFDNVCVFCQNPYRLPMHRKLKVLIAGWLASRIESRTRRVRRALRDHQRAELRRIHDSDRRARGLRLYTAWSCKENKAMNDRTVVPLPLVQPVVSDDVAAAMADVAVEEPLNGTVELAGPEPIRLDELVQGFLSANRDARKVTTDVHALYPRR
jgi:hypothetical protein